MAKRKKNNKGIGFPLFLAVYAVLFLGLTAFGLNWLWGCMEAYEASRPYLAIDSYMAKVDKEYILERNPELLTAVDPAIQSEEECRKIILNSLKGEIGYARKASACTEDRQVFVVRCGKQVVGSFSIVTTAADQYGFKPWTFEEESYDLSYLMGTETVTISAPEGYPVYVNGVLLDESYIIETTSEEFAAYGDYYKKYDLPLFVMHTYEVGPFLGETIQPEVYDLEGQSFVYDETFDPNVLLPQLDSALQLELESFGEDFLEVYVIFAGCANDAREINYKRVMEYVVKDSNLAQRMFDALEGYQFAQSMGDKVAGIDIHHLLPLEEGKYLCDVTYMVDTTGHEGVVQTTTNCRIIIVESDGKYLVESKIIY